MGLAADAPRDGPGAPPHRAVEQLLDRIAEGTPEVTAEDRAAAARLADAYTAAAYAAPLPASATVSAPSGTASSSDDAAGGTARHPLRHDADRIVGLIRTAR
ncbi:hypothetical protein [Brachybacterium sp. GPGPB12]|uniref:hypothetical protein n=1 Tax=Brachybacterium sp. GPGPB12 TaxID=3023517 RepID=UPI00313455E2